MYLLKHRNIWGTEQPSQCSWGWWRILQLREEVHPYIKHKIGNGRSTSFWFDNWHPIVPLFQHFPENLLHAFGFAKEDKVEKFIIEGGWKWPQGRRCNQEMRRMQAGIWIYCAE